MKYDYIKNASILWNEFHSPASISIELKHLQQHTTSKPSMILTKLFTLSLLTSTALASGITIIAAMGVISDTTTALDDAVTAWDGSLDGTAAIVNLSDQFLSDAVIAKVPAILQDTAQSLVQPILDAFDDAIAAYSS